MKKSLASLTILMALAAGAQNPPHPQEETVKPPVAGAPHDRAAPPQADGQKNRTDKHHHGDKRPPKAPQHDGEQGQQPPQHDGEQPPKAPRHSGKQGQQPPQHDGKQPPHNRQVDDGQQQTPPPPPQQHK